MAKNMCFLKIILLIKFLQFFWTNHHISLLGGFWHVTKNVMES